MYACDVCVCAVDDKVSVPKLIIRDVCVSSVSYYTLRARAAGDHKEKLRGKTSTINYVRISDGGETFSVSLFRDSRTCYCYAHVIV